MSERLIPQSLGETIGRGGKITGVLISTGRPVVFDRKYDRDLVIYMIVLTSETPQIPEGSLVRWELVGRDRTAWKRVMRSRTAHIPQVGDILTIRSVGRNRAKIAVTPLPEASEEQVTDMIAKVGMVAKEMDPMLDSILARLN